MSPSEPQVTIESPDGAFAAWEEVLALLHAAFAYQEPRIDPPSSLHRLDVRSLAAKAADEHLILATLDGTIIGCAFARQASDVVYLGKLAVSPAHQGHGIGARLLAAVEAYAVARGVDTVELETRIELTENHETFGKLGFIKVSEGTHAGFTRPTFIKMRKRIRS